MVAIRTKGEDILEYSRIEEKIETAKSIKNSGLGLMLTGAAMFLPTLTMMALNKQEVGIEKIFSDPFSTYVFASVVVCSTIALIGRSYMGIGKKVLGHYETRKKDILERYPMPVCRYQHF